MTALEKVKDWLGNYPGFDILSTFQVDYTSEVPGCGGLFPAGLVELGRRRDILGNTTVENQYNFALYYVFEKAPGDETGAAGNAAWVMDFQEWVQEQSVCGAVPRFGNTSTRETAKAENGTLYEVDGEGTALYSVQLSIRFEKRFER